jgi:putative ABC transport system permease protein
MSWILGARTRLAQLLGRAAAEERMDEEIRFHIEMEAQKNLRAGMSPAEAQRRARIAFGGVEGHREEMRAGRRVPLLEELWRDLRHAARSLRRTPAFTAAAALMLALGVGTNTAVFGLVSATLLRPLPFAEPERLVVLHQTVAEPGEPVRPRPWSYPEFEAVRAAVGSVSHLSAYYATDANLAGSGDPLRVRLEMVSAAYFPALAVRPALGRGFLPEEDAAPGARPVVVLGHDLWRRDFGGDPAVLGRAVSLNGVPLTVMGVAQPGFAGLTGDAEVWIPQAMAPAVSYAEQLTTTQHFLSVVGRLAPGATLEQARAEVATAGARAAAGARERAGSEPGGAWTAALLPLEEARRDPATVRAQLVLAGAVFLVLLLASVNLSGLLLARSLGRARETAIRASLGAGRRRLVRQALVESGLVGALGGALGLLLAAGSTKVLADLAPEQLGLVQPRRGWDVAAFAAPGADWRVVLFAGALALAAGVLAGLLPALRATRGDLAAALRGGGRGSSVAVGSLRRPTALSAVVVAQIALALVLLVGAGILLQGFHRLRSADPGFRAAGVLSFRLSPPAAQYGGAAAAPLLQQVL